MNKGRGGQYLKVLPQYSALLAPGFTDPDLKPGSKEERKAGSAKQAADRRQIPGYHLLSPLLDLNLRCKPEQGVVNRVGLLFRPY